MSHPGIKHIALFGAGKSATVLIDYLKSVADENVWKVTVADGNYEMAASKTGIHPLVKPVALNIENAEERSSLIQEADLVISMMPPHLHYLIADDCLQHGRHLLTASYLDDHIKKLSKQVAEKNVLFLCEMGLDPGIDHMSAMQMFEDIHAAGGTIHSFKSHCGGLIAPESDDNPWHYKISWNPRNIIMAGKAGAVYKERGQVVHKKYEELFDPEKIVRAGDDEIYAYYPNRDSLPYIDLYNLSGIDTFIRTTLRHPEFSFGWKNIVDLKLTDEEIVYDTSDMTVAEFFKEHFDKHKFQEWIANMLTARLGYAREMMEKLMTLMEAEEERSKEGVEENEFMMVDEKGELSSMDVDDIKDKAAESVASKMHEANLGMRQLFYLGLDDETLINKGICSAADVLQFIVERKLALHPDDKDMIVMMHELEYTIGTKKYYQQSRLVVKGEDSVHTAMAKTVGLPLGIAAKLLLEGRIKERGLHIPTASGIYKPVLRELENHGIIFHESKREM